MDALLDNKVEDRRKGRLTRLGILVEPLGYPDGVNRYQFILSDPVGMVDPSGESGEDIGQIDEIVRRLGLSPEGRRALHDALTPFKQANGMVPPKTLEELANQIKSQGGKYLQAAAPCEGALANASAQAADDALKAAQKNAAQLESDMAALAEELAKKGAGKGSKLGGLGRFGGRLLGIVGLIWSVVDTDKVEAQELYTADQLRQWELDALSADLATQSLNAAIVGAAQRLAQEHECVRPVQIKN